MALAGGLTVRAAAKRAGVSERTATRRWADAAFRRRVGELRAELLTRASGQLAGNMSKAARTLGKLLRSEDERIAFQAAKAILETGVRIRDAAELEARLTALEKHMGEPGR
jgi:AcrR family transcriptional regulator